MVYVIILCYLVSQCRKKLSMFTNCQKQMSLPQHIMMSDAGERQYRYSVQSVIFLKIEVSVVPSRVLIITRKNDDISLYNILSLSYCYYKLPVNNEHSRYRHTVSTKRTSQLILDHYSLFLHIMHMHILIHIQTDETELT